MKIVRHLLIIFFLTIFWFSSLTGSSEVICSGEPAGKAFGNFVLWNMPDPSTSLSMLVDLKLFFIDFSFSYALTSFIFLLVMLVFKCRQSIFDNKRWFILFFVVIISFSVYFSLSFLFGINIDVINCERIPETFSFGLRSYF